ncbi:MAG: molybdopterin-dependent oxidoreductase [Proteobacteria bacterium]|nr:molybdopterin-dependent oxidoreductase [Pseudomonadota bacterium]
MKKRGVGIAAGLYPTGMSGGGDSSQAIVKMQPDGSAVLTVGAVDLGQGSKTVLAQMVAEVLGIDCDQVRVVNDNTDSCPLSFGSFASRVTYVDGNAVVEAAEEARSALLDVAAEMLEASVGDLEVVEGNIRVKQSPESSKAIGEVAGAATFGMRKLIVGRGHYMRDPSGPDPETGQVDPFCTLAWAAMMAEVEVDTETGEVEVLGLIASYDVGKAINPSLTEGQIEGGAAMGLGAALAEQLHPAYPSLEFQPTNLGDYAIPTAVDVPDIEAVIHECPSTNGPFGAKGLGEMTANVPAPAIINAIHDAVGIWIDELPATPERVLRALEEKAGS